MLQGSVWMGMGVYPKMVITVQGLEYYIQKKSQMFKDYWTLFPFPPA